MAAGQRDWAVQAALERLTCLSSALVRPVKVPIMRQPGKPEYHVMTHIEAQSNSEGPAAQSRDNSPQLCQTPLLDNGYFVTNFCLAPKALQWVVHTLLNGAPARALTLR